MMHKQQLYQIAAVAVASAQVDIAASEAFTNVLRLSHSRSMQQQAAQWTAVAFVTVNPFGFLRVERCPKYSTCAARPHDAGRNAGVVEVYKASRGELFTTRAQHDDTVMPHVLPGRLLAAVLGRVWSL